MFAPMRKDSADGFLGVGQGFLLGVTLGDDLRQSGDEHRKATLFLRLQYDREAVVRGHLRLHARVLRAKSRLTMAVAHSRLLVHYIFN
jgi:hypothetical protein